MEDVYSDGEAAVWPVVVAPMQSIRAARTRVKWENLTREQKAEKIAGLLERQYHNLVIHNEWDELSLRILCMMGG